MEINKRNSNIYPAQIKKQTITKASMNDMHSIVIKRKAPSKTLNATSLNQSINSMNVNSNKFGLSPIMNNLF